MLELHFTEFRWRWYHVICLRHTESAVVCVENPKPRFMKVRTANSTPFIVISTLLWVLIRTQVESKDLFQQNKLKSK